MYWNPALTMEKSQKLILGGGLHNSSVLCIGVTLRDLHIGVYIYTIRKNPCNNRIYAMISDIKPNNFVLTRDAHVLLLDFGSAAPLLPPREDGSQLLPKRYCLVPCGTCDYISPEILKAHEAALVALELEDEDEFDEPRMEDDTDGYGRETDWWSLGAMLYEMAYGFAPFFAKDIRQTYLRIIDHEVFI